MRQLANDISLRLVVVPTRHRICEPGNAVRIDIEMVVCPFDDQRAVVILRYEGAVGVSPLLSVVVLDADNSWSNAASARRVSRPISSKVCNGMAVYES